jgi:hypothetical protein
VVAEGELIFRFSTVYSCHYCEMVSVLKLSISDVGHLITEYNNYRYFDYLIMLSCWCFWDSVLSINVLYLKDLGVSISKQTNMLVIIDKILKYMNE